MTPLSPPLPQPARWRRARTHAAGCRPPPLTPPPTPPPPPSQQPPSPALTPTPLLPPTPPTPRPRPRLARSRNNRVRRSPGQPCTSAPPPICARPGGARAARRPCSACSGCRTADGYSLPAAAAAASRTSSTRATSRPRPAERNCCSATDAPTSTAVPTRMHTPQAESADTASSKPSTPRSSPAGIACSSSGLFCERTPSCIARTRTSRTASSHKRCRRATRGGCCTTACSTGHATARPAHAPWRCYCARSCSPDA